MKHVTVIAGARPNFIKIAPIVRAIQQCPQLEYSLVHTGQHYDDKMSEIFFEELDIPKPHANLNCGGGSQAEQTAAIMIGFERYLQDNPTDIVLVVGDVTSTMACTIVAQKSGVRVAHVEGGLRSRDWSMPEEINRLVTDAISNYFFTTTREASFNLINSGVSADRIFFVGNTMIDTLLTQLPRLQKPLCWEELCLEPRQYIVLTLHRPSNVDNKLHMQKILEQACKGALDRKIVFPIHPRTQKIVDQIKIQFENLHIIDPLGYLEFNYLVKSSLGVITDSGGITEETTVMGVPCITLRDSTERPETVTIGTNSIIGTDPTKIPLALEVLIQGRWKKGGIPELWDGLSATRIVEHLLKL
jgi:UDP-N-acetylglucosamine 2-epimerase (non-hydrolysing)